MATRHLLVNQKLLVRNAERIVACMEYFVEQVEDESAVAVLNSLKNRLIGVVNRLADAMCQSAHQKENNALELLKKFPSQFKGLARQFDFVLEDSNAE